ncbi:TPA: hypothetical protein QHC10_005380 [Klebsiella quasipneumoniae subsp. similipneumoniae]|nr:hypothetical protein [Klebsiella quasipneumoniae subsp. similipneumoniae]
MALTYQGLFHFIVQQNGCSTLEQISLSVLVALLLWQETPETVAMVVILPLLILAFLQAVGRAAIQRVILLEVLPARPL